MSECQHLINFGLPIVPNGVGSWALKWMARRYSLVVNNVPNGCNLRSRYLNRYVSSLFLTMFDEAPVNE